MTTTMLENGAAGLQATLPLFAHAGGAWQGGSPAFAHPAEQELARLLTFFHIRWTYEPTTFALRRHGDGSIAEAFAPDFFLPDLRLYLELTTMRQKLVTRKNRKARLLRELFPNVHLRLIYRRDYFRLMECYRSELQRSDGADLCGVVRTADEIANAVEELAVRLLARFHRVGQSGPIVLLSTSRSSRRFQRDLAACLTQVGVRAEVAELTLLGQDGPFNQPRFRTSRSTLDVLRNGQVALVDTLVSSGLTLAHAQRWLGERSIDVVQTAALFARPGCRIGNATLDHVPFEAPNDAVAGYGLQLHAAFTDLPYVARLRSSNSGGINPLNFSIGID